MLQNSKDALSARPAASRYRLLLVIVAVAAPSMLAIRSMLKFADRVSSPVEGSILVFVAALVVVPGTIVLLLGIGQARAGFRELRAKVRWWHWLLLLAYISQLVFRLRDVPEARATPLDAWAILRLGPEAIIVTVLLGRLALRRPPWLPSLFRGPVAFLTAYALICSISTAWSVYPAWTLYHSLEYFMDIALLATVLVMVRTSEEYKAVMDWIWFVYAAGMVLVWIEAVLMPHLAFQPPTNRLEGVFPIENWNDLGTTAAVLTVIAVARIWRFDRQNGSRSWCLLLLLVFSFVTMLAAQTRNAIAGFLFGAFLVFLFSKRIWASMSFVALTITTLGSGAVRAFLERDTPQEVLAMNHLNGRMSFWGLAWDMIMKHPLTGLGAYAGGRFTVLAVLGQGEASTLHNDFLEVATGTSFWGLIPFLLALVLTWVILIRAIGNRSLAADERQLALEGIGIVGVLTVHAFFNTDLSWHAPLIYFAALGCAEFLRRRQTAQNIYDRRLMMKLHSAAAVALTPEITGTRS
jgi:O-antigen ligase